MPADVHHDLAHDGARRDVLLRARVMIERYDLQPFLTSEDKSPPARLGGSSPTGMSRFVPAWNLSYSSHADVMIGQPRRLSSAVPVSALTGRTLSHTWI